MPRATMRYAIGSMTHGAESLLRGRQNELPQYSRTGEQLNTAQADQSSPESSFPAPRQQSRRETAAITAVPATRPQSAQEVPTENETATGARPLVIDSDSWKPEQLLTNLRKLSTHTQREMAWSMVGKGLQASYDAKIKGWNDELDYYLVYSSIFSAVLTAFNVQVYPSLLEPNDPNAASLALSRRLMVSMNLLFFLSLVLTLAGTTFGVMTKQWIYGSHIEDIHLTQVAAQRRWYRARNLSRWRISSIIGFLFFLFEVSLVLFFGGLFILLWGLNRAIAITTTVLGGIILITIAITIVLPLCYAHCCFLSPPTYAMYYLAESLRYSWKMLKQKCSEGTMVQAQTVTSSSSTQNQNQNPPIVPSTVSPRPTSENHSTIHPQARAPSFPSSTAPPPSPTPQPAAQTHGTNESSPDILLVVRMSSSRASQESDSGSTAATLRSALSATSSGFRTWKAREKAAMDAVWGDPEFWSAVILQGLVGPDDDSILHLMPMMEEDAAWKCLNAIRKAGDEVPLIHVDFWIVSLLLVLPHLGKYNTSGSQAMERWIHDSITSALGRIKHEVDLEKFAQGHMRAPCLLLALSHLVQYAALEESRVIALDQLYWTYTWQAQPPSCPWSLIGYASQVMKQEVQEVLNMEKRTVKHTERMMHCAEYLVYYTLQALIKRADKRDFPASLGLFALLALGKLLTLGSPHTEDDKPDFLMIDTVCKGISKIYDVLRNLAGISKGSTWTFFREAKIHSELTPVVQQWLEEATGEVSARFSINLPSKDEEVASESVEAAKETLYLYDSRTRPTVDSIAYQYEIGPPF